MSPKNLQSAPLARHRRLQLQQQRITTIFEVGRRLLSADNESDRPDVELTVRRVSQDPRTMVGNTILVLTDRKERARYYMTALATLGHEVLLTNDMMSTARLYRRLKDEVGLVLIDMRLERTEGKQAFEYLRWVDPEVKTLLLADGPNAYDLKRLEANGLLAVLSRHLTPQSLGHEVDRQLARLAGKQDENSTHAENKAANQGG